MNNIRNIYVRGDVHRNFDFLESWCIENQTTKDDILIILGDVGINFTSDHNDYYIKKKISLLPITLLCVRGNHEKRPETVFGMQSIFIEPFNNFVFAEPEYDNIFYAKDGFVYNIKGKTFLTIGGAYSVDKFYRLSRGAKWFDNEQLTFKEQNKIFKTIKGKKFDYVLTHSCPLKWEPVELFLGFIDQASVDKNTEVWLSEVEKNITYDNWYFGHYHGEKDIYNDGKVLMFYHNFKKLEL